MADNIIGFDGKLYATRSIGAQEGFEVNNVVVLTHNSLGAGIINSGLTSLGTLLQLNVSGSSTMSTLYSGSVTSTGVITNGTNSMTTGAITSSGAITNGTNSMTTGALSVSSLNTSSGTIGTLCTTTIKTGTSNYNITLPSSAPTASNMVLTTTTSASNSQLVWATANSLITSSQWSTSGNDISYSSGNVGIGITNPSSKLQVIGKLRIGSANSSNYSHPFMVSLNTDVAVTGNNSNLANIYFRCNGTDNYAEIVSNDFGLRGGVNQPLRIVGSPIEFNTYGGGGATPTMTLTNSNEYGLGYVGIGITNPAVPLQVKGVGPSLQAAQNNADGNTSVSQVTGIFNLYLNIPSWTLGQSPVTYAQYNSNVSGLFSHYVVTGSGFAIFSDRRIKTNISKVRYFQRCLMFPRPLASSTRQGW